MHYYKCKPKIIGGRAGNELGYIAHHHNRMPHPMPHPLTLLRSGMMYSVDLRSVITNSPTMGANISLRHHSTGVGRGKGREKEDGGEGGRREDEKVIRVHHPCSMQLQG